MAGRSSRPLWRRAAIGCCLLWALTALAAASAAMLPTRSASAVTGPSLRVLQLNLCDSGIAGCYTGRSVHQAADLIRAVRPDVVTLNEVCRDDMGVLERALSDTAAGGNVASTFEAAVDRRTERAFKCRNGQQYGIGIVARVQPSYQGTDIDKAVYPIQDTGDPEERVWLCLHAVTDTYLCTTHLASTSTTIALAQCRDLLHTALPELRARHGSDPLVLGGDLNLRSGGSPDADSCLPPGYARADDGVVQHIVASPDFTVQSTTVISMHGTTDHPGLLVDLTRHRATSHRVSRAR